MLEDPLESEERLDGRRLGHFLMIVVSMREQHSKSVFKPLKTAKKLERHFPHQISSY
jgi:hypothetical protein